MESTNESLEAQLADAYASGDAQRVSALLSGSATAFTTSPTADAGRAQGALKLRPDAAEFVPRGATPLAAASVKPDVPTTLTAETEDADTHDQDYGDDTDTVFDDEDPLFSVLEEEFPHADPGILHAILAAHQGDTGAARASLSELDALNALSDIAPAVTTSSPSAKYVVDAKAYTEAVSEFEEQFPSLGGGSAKPASKKPIQSHNASAPYADGRLLRTVRERHLIEKLSWVPRDAVLQTLRDCSGDASAAERAIARRYPRPADQDHRESQRRTKVLRNLPPSRNDTDTGRFSQDRRDASSRTKWVATGESVAALYKSRRADAQNEARQRNKYFERAAAAARAGKGAEAARLGRLGRAANTAMKEMHREAAEMIWADQNPNPVRDGQIDLHGLHIREAVEYLPDALEEVSQYRSSIRVLTGTGHHTKGGSGAPRLRPTVETLLSDLQYSFKPVHDSRTGQVGAFVVNLR